MRAFAAAGLVFRTGCSRVKLDGRMLKLLLKPRRAVSVRVAVEMDDDVRSLVML